MKIWLTETFLNLYSKNWFFLVKYDSQNSKNWTFFQQMTRRIDFLKNINQNKETFLMTHRIKLCQKKTWLTELNHFFQMTHGIEPFFLTWLNDLNFLLNMTQRIELVVEHDSNNWLSSFFRTTQRFCCIRLKESNFFFRIWPNESNLFWNYFQRFFQYDSQNWTSFSALFKEWNIWEYGSKNWTSFEMTHDTKNWTSCEIWPKELSLLF